MRERIDNFVHWLEDTVSLGSWLRDLDLNLDDEALNADLSYGRDDDEVWPDEPVSPTLH